MHQQMNDYHRQIDNRSHKKNKFTPEEDTTLRLLVAEFGDKKWFQIGKLMKNRSGRQCRERWSNYLRPDITKRTWCQEEDQFIVDKFQEIGPCWRHIATLMNGRSEIAVKNRFKSLSRKSTVIKHKTPTFAKPEVPKTDNTDTDAQVTASMFNFDDTVYELFGNNDFHNDI